MDRKFKTVPIGELKDAPHNPPSRIKKENVQRLAQSIEQYGLVYPPAVSDDMQIIEGHRRVAACKLLGWTEMPIIIVKGDRDALNSHNRRPRRPPCAIISRFNVRRGISHRYSRI